MKTINIKDELNILNTGYKYLLLGDSDYLKNPGNTDNIKNKITKTELEFDERFWGTLGNFNESRITWMGELVYSGLGNFNSEGITKELKQAIINNTGIENLSASKIRERFVSFDKIIFTDSIKDKNSLRLTVFLNQDEGALVYYQHYDNDEEYPEIKNNPGYDFDIIHPEATKNINGQIDYNTTDRDRLDYEIEIEPGIIGTEITSEPLKNRKHFVIKILTFKRDAKSNEEIIKHAEEKIFGYEHRYGILVFNKEKDEFAPLKKNENDIKPDLKTLFLIHGTFVNTEHSFKAILNKTNNSQSLLKQYLNQPNSRHQQVIAFDHPTMHDDASENAMYLMKMLDEYQPGFAFTKHLDVIATSRGALVAKYLAMEYEKNSGENSKIAIEKIITVSGANGCGYLAKGKNYINILLKICDKGSPMQIVLLGLAQLSVKYITTRKGMRLLTPGDPILENILKYKPQPNSPTYVLTLSSDFEVLKAKNLDKKIINFFIRIGDRLIQSILGKQHDFVVGTAEQEISDPFPKVHLPGNKLFSDMHGKILYNQAAWPLILKFLNN